MITLYDYELSGNCYKLRLFMSILGIKYETRSVDFYPGREHKSEWFLKINPLGQLPVLQDDDLVLRDAQAILVYLAERYDHSRLWYPRDKPATLGRIAMWLAFRRFNHRDSLCGAAARRLVLRSRYRRRARRSASALPHPRRASVVRRARGPELHRDPRPPDHRRHRLFPLHHAVGGRRYFAAGLSCYPSLGRSFQAHARLHRDVGHLSHIRGKAVDPSDAPFPSSMTHAGSLPISSKLMTRVRFPSPATVVPLFAAPVGATGAKPHLIAEGQAYLQPGPHLVPELRQPHRSVR